MPYIIMASLVLIYLFVFSLLLPSLSIGQVFLVSIAAISPLIFVPRLFQPETIPFKHFLLDIQGCITVASDRHYDVVASSKVYPWGCLVALKKQDKTFNLENIHLDINSIKRQTRRFWIYKDSVSDENYRRLCRTILAKEVN